MLNNQRNLSSGPTSKRGTKDNTPKPSVKIEDTLVETLIENIQQMKAQIKELNRQKNDLLEILSSRDTELTNHGLID